MIDEMKEGSGLDLRALDAEVHEKVFGERLRTETARQLVPDYSGDIAAAWQVVEKLTEGEYVKVSCNTSHYHGDYCTIIAAHESQRDATSLVKQDVFAQWGNTMAEAICLAALKAVGQ